MTNHYLLVFFLLELQRSMLERVMGKTRSQEER